MAWPMALPARKSAACPDTDELSWLSEDKEKVLCPCLLRSVQSSEKQHGNGGRRHDGGRRPAEGEGKRSNRKATHLVSPTANPHHGCHHGYSHEAVDDGAPKQRLDGIERGKINPNSEDGCGDDYAVKADGLPRLVFESAFPAL